MSLRRWVWAFVLLAGCAAPKEAVEPAPEEPKAQATDRVELSTEAAKAAGIVVQTIEPSAFQASFSVPGVVQSVPDRSARVTPPTAGRVLQFLVRMGDSVQAGQPLAVLESVELTERAGAVTEARRGILAAQAEVARAEGERALAQERQRTTGQALARQRGLARTGAFSQPSLQAAERALSDARAALESAQREAAVHRAQLERSERLYRQELVSRVELEDARLDVEKDRIAQERAQRELQIAQAAFERERSIGSKGLLNAREIQAAEADERAARLEVGRAGIALRSAQAALQGAKASSVDAQGAYVALRGKGNLAQGGRLTVTAPIGGRIVHREGSVGQAVERTTELFEIDDRRVVTVVAQVSERDVARIRAGAKVGVSTDAFPGRIFAGAVETLDGRLDPKTRTLAVRCRVSNADGTLRPETFVRVALGTGPESRALTVPHDAVVEEGDRRFVFVETAAGTYIRREVTLGKVQGDRVEIVRGLQAGSRVVVAGVFTLRSELKKDDLKGEE